MNLLAPEPTSYDLNFRLGSIPVRVHPGFWIVQGVIGYFLADTLGAAYFFVWVGCAFGSILVHELGHVFAGRRFGADGEIVLTVFGGLAVGSPDVHYRYERILVYLAGPVAQLLLAALLWLAHPLVAASPDPNRVGQTPAEMTWMFLMSINVGWPLFNLLPIPPLDGGRILVEVVEWLRTGDRQPWEQDPNWWKRG